MDVGISEISRQILAVFAVFGLMGLAVWKLRSGPIRFKGWNPGRSASKALVAVERIPLTPQHTVHLLTIHGRQLVVATHPQGCSVLLDSPGASV
ncbi:MAG: hypothetical protein ABI995_05650 [Acidobacteriota bacterium]